MKNADIKQIENIKNKNDTYVIRWQMTSLCNYNCDFCIQGNRKTHIEASKGESAKVRMQIADKFVEFIEGELNHKYKYIKIYLIGGEVTILKDFMDILKKLVCVNFDGEIRYHITTNLSADKETLLEMTKMFRGFYHKKRLRVLHISASFYKAFTTEEEFISKIKFIRNPHKKINRISLDQKYYYEKGIINKFKLIISKILGKVNRTIVLSIGYPLIDDEDYTLYQEFKNKYNRLVDSIEYIIIRNYKEGISKNIKDKLNRDESKKIKVITMNGKELYFYRTSDISEEIEGGFKPTGMSCDVGVNSISIDSNGNISRCVSCKEESMVGNIIEDNFKCLEKTYICPSKTCSCTYYGTIKKN